MKASLKKEDYRMVFDKKFQSKGRLASGLKIQIVLAVLGLTAWLFLLGVNLCLVYPWFSGKGPANIGSIEVSYISMARFLRDFSPHLSFAPYWYFGFPFHLFYTPLLPFLISLLNQFLNYPLWQGYRIVTGAGFALIPASIFLFTWYLTKNIIAGILAGLGYTFLPSLFYYILPSGEVASDVISANFFDPRRLVILSRWGEGPHTLSLVFLPLAGLFYLRLIDRRKRWDMFLAAVFLGLTALTNAVGFYGAIILFLAIFFSRWVKKPKKFKSTFKTSLLTVILCYGLIAFWYNLSFVGSFFGEGGGMLKNYASLFPWGLLFLFFGVLALYFLFQKFIKDRGLVVALTWFLILFLIVYVYYASAPPQFSQQRIELVPQALRLMTEVDMAFSVLLAALLGWAVAFLAKKNKVLGIFGNSVGLGLVLILLSYGFAYLPYGRKAVSGEVELSKTGEYQISKWLEQRVDTGKGERVYVAGNYGFYLNYFTDVWQLRGGLYQAMTHFWPEHIFYQINRGKDKEIALAWLKASNIKYIVVNDSSSRELYKEFKTPEKFADLKKIYENEGDLIYEVPLISSSPVKIVDLVAMRRLLTPTKADDKDALLAYIAWLDRSQPASFNMVDHDFYQIRTDLTTGQGILVQMTYDPGFKAVSSLGRLKVEKDPLGFMVLIPAKSGSMEISLTHGKTWKIYLGYLTTAVAIILWFTYPLLKKAGRKVERKDDGS